MKKEWKYPLIVGGIALAIIVLIVFISVFSPSEISTGTQNTQTKPITEPRTSLDPELYPADAGGCSVECTQDSDCVIDNCLGCFNRENLKKEECMKECPRPEKASCRCLEGKCITM